MSLYRYSLIVILAVLPNAIIAAQGKPNVIIVLVDSIRREGSRTPLSGAAYVSRLANKTDLDLIQVRESSLTPELLSQALRARVGSVRKHGKVATRSVGVTLPLGLKYPPLSPERRIAMESLQADLRRAPARTVKGLGHFRSIAIAVPDSI